MEYFTKLFNLWQIKLIIGSVFAVFAPFKIAFWVLLAFIVIDTVTACCNAIKTRKFSSKRFQKGVKKILTYFTTIIVVRMLEVGIAPLLSTTMITRLITTFLILTEAISILENLTLCGVPLPPGVLRLILGSLNFEKFYEIFGRGFDKQKYLAEIDEIIQYQVPMVKQECTRKLLAIKFEEWKNAVSIIDQQLSENLPDSNELLFYRILSLIKSTDNMVYDKCVTECIPTSCIDNFKKCHSERVEDFIKNIKLICYKNDSIEYKRKAIIENTIVILYQTVIDVQKSEALEEK